MSQSGNNTSTSTSTVSVSQVLSLPIGQNLSNPLTRTLAPSPGSIAFDSGLQKLYIGTTTGWVLVTSA